MVYPAKLSLIKQRNSSKVELVCPAKINLYLNILGQYPGGFHRIETIVNRISLCDELTIELKKDSSLDKMYCTDKSLESKHNLCIKALSLLKKELKIRKGFSLFLKKNIPVGAGLGGGSSCAASTILGINTLLNLKLSLSSLYRLGAQLGSDVNFFLSQSSYAYLWGKGEKVRPLNVDTQLEYFIVYPSQRVSTGSVYRKVKGKLTKFFNNVNMISYALKKNDFELLEANMFNALEKIVFFIFPLLERKKSFLKNYGFKMTGSGSAFFTLLNQRKDLRSLRKGVPKNWILYKAVSL